MPSKRVFDFQIEITLEDYDAVGCDGQSLAFIAHVGLARGSGQFPRGNCPIIDMAPPLHGPGHPNTTAVTVVGTAELSVDEQRKISLFVDLHASEHASVNAVGRRQLFALAPQMYCIVPHAELLTEEDGRTIRTRFSCAGFVLEAYRAARIDLLDTDALPLVSANDVRLGYPREFQLADRDLVRLSDLGLHGDGPWPVLFCGYLFHSLARDAATIRTERFVAQLSHRNF